MIKIQYLVHDKYEHKTLKLRRLFNFLSKGYNSYHNINLENQPKIKTNCNLEGDIQRANDNLIKFKSALDTPASDNSNIPKKIWMYWNGNLEEAPEVVQLSIQSWKALNPNYELTVINDENIQDILGFDFNLIFTISTIRLTIAAKADLLRLYLLTKYGGVWVDATTFCLKPLDSWLEDAAKSHSFFCFRHQSVKSRPIEAWFLASSKSAPVIKDTLEIFTDYVFKKRKDSLFTTSKKKLLNKVGISDKNKELIYANKVYEAEKIGTMPYFTIGYFFNESVRKNYSPMEIENLMKLRNEHSINFSNTEVFKNSLVSKQTYKDDYTSSALFKARKDYIKGLISQL